jgi:hypothetical protein
MDDYVRLEMVEDSRDVCFGCDICCVVREARIVGSGLWPTADDCNTHRGVLEQLLDNMTTKKAAPASNDHSRTLVSAVGRHFGSVLCWRMV